MKGSNPTIYSPGERTISTLAAVLRQSNIPSLKLYPGVTERNGGRPDLLRFLQQNKKYLLIKSRNSQPFTESDTSSPYSQQQATGPTPELHKFSPQVTNLHLLTPILIISSLLYLHLPRDTLPSIQLISPTSTELNESDPQSQLFVFQVHFNIILTLQFESSA
jgi:hypothetical protein